MNWKEEGHKLAAMVAVFVAFLFLPLGWARFDNAVMESPRLTKWYAEEHVLLCLVPALFIAGAIGVLTIILMARILGPELSLARAIGAISFSVVIGLLMHLIYRKEEVRKADAQAAAPAALLAMLFPSQPMIAFGAAVVGLAAITSGDRGASGEWFSSTWGFAKMILPLLFFGVLIGGFLLGRQRGRRASFPVIG